MATGVRTARREPGGTTKPSAALAGYLAPVHLDWLTREPDRGWRELEATVVFADVSGFTQLGERLARNGRIGDEQLTDAITAVFNGMNQAARKAGGEIVKFGGDAVLALFAGTDHEARGAAAALAMQAALGEVRRTGVAEAVAKMRLPSAVAALQLSAGVASGTAHLFLAGTDPRDLIVAGPLASEVVSIESAAEAGEVLISSATAAAIAPECSGEVREAGSLLVAAPATAKTVSPEPPRGADPLPGLPHHLHDHEPDYGEHRIATVAFIQFKGSDELLETEGAATLSEALDGIVSAAAEASRAWGVALVSSDVDRDGGKLILTAGAPTAQPDDEDRMLHALRQVVAAEWPLAIRAGVNRGPLFTADIGTDERRVWSVMGDAVNLAARVMSHAEPGQILATPSVTDRARDDFKRTPVEPFSVKGKSGQVQAEAIGEAQGTRRVDAASDAPLVGRDEELAQLREALAVAREGLRRVIALVGEPGMGKSRLIEAATASADGMNVVKVEGGPYAAHTPYLAVRRTLRGILGADSLEGVELAEALTERVRELDSRLTPWLPLIGIAFGVDFDPTQATSALAPEFAAARLHGAVGRFMDMLLPRRPTLIVVEDAHWLDTASAELLVYLLSQQRDSSSPDPAHVPGYAAVLTTRDVPEGAWVGEVPGLVRLPLGPLPADDARLLVLPGSAEEDALPASVREKLIERAHGNPLLLRELIAAAQAGTALEDLPDSVEALMTARIDTLPRSDRRLLREAAVLGIQVSRELLEDIFELDGDAATAAVRRLSGFLLDEGPVVRFSHALLRDAAYGTLPFRRRRELHARAAAAIESRAGREARRSPNVELLAIHNHAAALWPEAWETGRIAGERALERAAPVEAAGFLAGALEAARHLRGLDPRDVGRVAELLGDAAELGGRYDDAAAAYAQARRRAGDDPLALASLCLKEGRLREESKHLAQALAWYTRGLKRLGQRTDRDATSMRARLTLAQGAARVRAGRLREALPYLEGAVKGAWTAGDRATVAHGYYLLDWAHTDLGSPDASRYRDLALPIFVELGDYARQGRVLNNLGVDAYHEGRWDDAVDLYEQSRQASERAGDAVEAATALNNIAEIRLEQGRLDEAEEMLRDSLATWRAAGFAAGIGTALKNLGCIASERGELDRAAELLARGRARFDSIGAIGLALEIDAHEAQRLLRAGRSAQARRLAADTQAAAEAAGVSLPSVVAAVLDRVLTA